MNRPVTPKRQVSRLPARLRPKGERGGAEFTAVARLVMGHSPNRLKTDPAACRVRPAGRWKPPLFLTVPEPGRIEPGNVPTEDR